MAELKIEGLEQVIAKLDKMAGVVWLRTTLITAAIMVKNEVAKYPAASEANTPYQRRWYQRGWGTKWMRKDGSVNGRQTSETLGRRWHYKRVESAGEMQMVIGNNASYAPFVQGAEKQAAFHKSRGWVTAEAALEQARPMIMRMVQDRVNEQLKG